MRVGVTRRGFTSAVSTGVGAILRGAVTIVALAAGPDSDDNDSDDNDDDDEEMVAAAPADESAVTGVSVTRRCGAGSVEGVIVGAMAEPAGVTSMGTTRLGAAPP
jgi:hypothetical protein